MAVKGMITILVVILKFNALLSLDVNMHLSIFQRVIHFISCPVIDLIKDFKCIYFSPSVSGGK